MANSWLNAVFDQSRSRSGVRLVALVLADRANDEGECWPSLADIARRAGLTERQARSCIRELERLGELVVTPGGGRHKVNKYRLTVTEPAPTGDASTGETRKPASAFGAPETRKSVSGYPANGARGNPEVCDRNPEVFDTKPGSRLPPNPQEPTGTLRTVPETRARVGEAVTAVPESPAARSLQRLIDAGRASTARARGSLTPSPLGTAVNGIVGKLGADEPRESKPGPRRRQRIPDAEQAMTKRLLLEAGIEPADAVDLATAGRYAEFEAAVELPSFGAARNKGGFLRQAVRNGWARAERNGHALAAGGER